MDRRIEISQGNGLEMLEGVIRLKNAVFRLRYSKKKKNTKELTLSQKESIFSIKKGQGVSFKELCTNGKFDSKFRLNIPNFLNFPTETVQATKSLYDTLKL